MYVYRNLSTQQIVFFATANSSMVYPYWEAVDESLAPPNAEQILAIRTATVAALTAGHWERYPDEAPGGGDGGSDAGSDAWLADSVSALSFTSLTRNSANTPTTGNVVWPDGTSGVYTSDTHSSVYPGAVDAYHVTYVGPVTKTVTQPAVTRNAVGAITAQPALIVT